MCVRECVYECAHTNTQRSRIARVLVIRLCVAGLLLILSFNNRVCGVKRALKNSFFKEGMLTDTLLVAFAFGSARMHSCMFKEVCFCMFSTRP